MLTTTKAIVLHLTKHKDNASILHTYTEEYGRINFLVYGIGKKKSKIPAALLTPLSLVECTFNYQQKNDIQTLKEINNNSSNIIAVTDINNTAISLFLSEILYLTLIHPLPEKQLFQFLTHYIEQIKVSNNPNIHIIFLLTYTEYLGIYPNFDDNRSIKPYFHIPSSEYISITDDESKCLSSDEIMLIRQLAENKEMIPMSRKKRQSILRKLCLYLEYNLEGFRTPRSLDILEEVFD